jgi:uncharacterized membrane protein
MNTSKINSILASLGITLSILLLFMKVGSLPCGTEACGEVINSPYGQFLGIPVSIFSMILWTILIASKPIEKPNTSRLIHQISCLVLGMGSIAFIMIQIFIIKALCPFCLAHSAFAIAYAVLNIKEPKAANASPLPYTILALGIFVATLGEKTYEYTPPSNIEVNTPQKIQKETPNTQGYTEYDLYAIKGETPVEITIRAYDGKITLLQEKTIKTEPVAPEDKKTEKPLQNLFDHFDETMSKPLPEIETTEKNGPDFQGLYWDEQGKLTGAIQENIRVYSLSCNHCRNEILQKIKAGKDHRPFLIRTPGNLQKAMEIIYGLVKNQEEFDKILKSICEDFKQFNNTPEVMAIILTGRQESSPEQQLIGKQNIQRQNQTIRDMGIRRFPSTIKVKAILEKPET